MTCRTYDLGNGVTFIGCTRGERVRKCKTCGERADLLCDFELGGVKKGKTCDAAICRRCATETGVEKHLCPPHAQLEVELRRQADAWLQGLMRDDANEVDRGALFELFPEWENDFIATGPRGHVASNASERTDGDVVSGAFWKRDDGTTSGIRKKPTHPDWVDPIDTHDFDGDTCTRCGMTAQDFEAGERDTCKERQQARRAAEQTRLWADHVKADNAKKRDELREREASAQPIAKKVEHVKRAGQTRAHGCHWPQCRAQVPPAMWGCRQHWYMLPKYLRDKIWNTYRAGQEATLTPSRAYLEAAREVEAWIITNHFPSRRAICGACGSERTVDDHMRRTRESQFIARPGESTDVYYCGCQDDPDEPHLEP